MAFPWTKYPYTNFQELNLDYILDKIKELLTFKATTTTNINILQAKNDEQDGRLDNQQGRIATLENAMDKDLSYYPLYNKKIIIYGDSISSYDTAPASTYQPNWVARFVDKLPTSTTVVNNAVPGMLMTGAGGIAQTMTQAASIDCDFLILFAGVNDFRYSRTLGNESDGYSTFNGALGDIRTAIEAKCPNATVIVISPIKTLQTTYPAGHIDACVLSLYRMCLYRWANSYGYIFIDGYGAPLLNPADADRRTQFQGDGVHPTKEYAEIFENYLGIRIAHTLSTGIYHETNRVTLTTDNANVTLTSAYADIMTDGKVTVSIAATVVNCDGSPVRLLTIPDFLLPTINNQTLNHVQNGSTHEMRDGFISSVSGNMTYRSSASGTDYVSASITYDLKCANQVFSVSL